MSEFWKCHIVQRFLSGRPSPPRPFRAALKIQGGGGSTGARNRRKAFLSQDPAAATEEASSTVEAEAAEILKQAKVAKHVADRAVKFAWAAVFICGVGVTLDLVGATVDYRSTLRSKEELDEEEAELEATGWPRWLHQLDA
eukprot:symbB.v1.2.002652.t1/scaffold142.1/size299426/10